MFKGIGLTDQLGFEQPQTSTVRVMFKGIGLTDQLGFEQPQTSTVWVMFKRIGLSDQLGFVVMIWVFLWRWRLKNAYC